MRPHVSRAKIRAPSPVLAVVLLAILVMASAVLGWLGGLVAWLIVLGALAVFAFCLRAAPDPGLSVRGTTLRPGSTARTLLVTLRHVVTETDLALGDGPAARLRHRHR